MNLPKVGKEEESANGNEPNTYWIYPKLVSEQMFFESDGKFPCYPFITKFWNNEDFMTRYDDDEEWLEQPNKKINLEKELEEQPEITEIIEPQIFVSAERIRKLDRKFESILKR